MSAEPAGALRSRRNPSNNNDANAQQQGLVREPSGNDRADAATDVSSESSEESSVVSSSSEDNSTDGSDQVESAQGGRPQDIRSRLAAFLPLLHEANRSLDHNTNAGFEVEDASEDERHAENENRWPDGRQYIEMNLGLGVLEQRQPDGDSDPADRESNPERSPSADAHDNSRGVRGDTTAVTASENFGPKHLRDPKRRRKVEVVDGAP